MDAYYVVDLEYSDELHEFHSDYSLAPKKLEINCNMLLKYCSSIATEYGIKIGGVDKLVPNLGNISKYILHYRNLQLCLCDWLKKHIDFNTNKRKNPANRFEKDIFKLMNSSTFGKTRGNLRKIIKGR